MWFLLGARVNKRTINAHVDGQWTMLQADGTEEQCTEDELIKNIQKHGDKVKWTSVEGKRERVPLKEQLAAGGHESRRPRKPQQGSYARSRD
jgi:hypothetical protein